MKHNDGFTLIELLVTVLLLSTGLLGLVGLQTAGMKNTLSSYNRTQATQLASSMADRMRANVADARLGSTSTYVTTTTFPTTQVDNCLNTTGCSPAQMAQNDLFEWNRDLNNIGNGLAKTGTITYVAPVFTVTISWGENRDDNKDGVIDPDVSFQTEFQL